MTGTAPPATQTGAGGDAWEGSATRATPTGARRDGLAALSFLAPSAAGFFTFTLLPILGALAIAFFSWPVLGERSFTGVSNFVELYTDDPMFWPAMRNTFVYVLVYVPINIVLALGLAAWINSAQIRFRSLYRVLFFLPAVTPLVANALVWRLLLQPRGVIPGYWEALTGQPAANLLGDSRYALLSVVVMSVWAGYGYNMLIFSAALDAVPEHLLEAATIDGAGTIRRFWSVTLPMLSPAMFFAGVLTLITSFQVFVQPFILTGGGPGVSTTTLVLYMYNRGFVFFDLGMASTIAVTLLAVIVLITGLQFVGQRRWVHYER